MDIAERKKQFVDYMKNWRNWYVRWTRIYGWIWNTLTLMTIIMSSIASMIAASSKKDDYQILIVILPALSALFIAILAQFKVKETWQMREDGRIALAELVGRARRVPTDDPAAFERMCGEIEAGAFAIDRDQNRRFFSGYTEKSPA